MDPVCLYCVLMCKRTQSDTGILGVPFEQRAVQAPWAPAPRYFSRHSVLPTSQLMTSLKLRKIASSRDSAFSIL